MIKTVCCGFCMFVHDADVWLNISCAMASLVNVGVTSNDTHYHYQGFSCHDDGFWEKLRMKRHIMQEN